jgi:hypothetical protein
MRRYRRENSGPGGTTDNEDKRESDMAEGLVPLGTAAALGAVTLTTSPAAAQTLPCARDPRIARNRAFLGEAANSPSGYYNKPLWITPISAYQPS